ncbi:MAG: purine-binding chemotaxis protein CheW [Fibrobacteria bacterium]|nr:purine-binding chemotaxis protein CheW [Fibrobacteria bacterium]
MDATTTVGNATENAVGQRLAGKYLTFRLAAEEYGLEILKVQEIIQLQSITRVPRTPSYVRGVINLRGKVIPVVDLRSKFNIEPTEDTEKTCIIVVQIRTGETLLVTGILIDEVREVLDIQAENIEDAPTFGASVETEFILGMGKVNGQVKILLDIDRVLTDSEASSLRAATIG